MMPFDYDAFAAWMESRKYAHRTIVGARSNLRRLERDGVATLDDIARIYACRTCKARTDLRWAFRLYLDFLNNNRLVSTFDEHGFRDYLDERRYSFSTIAVTCAAAKALHDAGIVEPDEIADRYGEHSRSHRTNLRRALRHYQEFQGVTG